MLQFAPLAGTVTYMEFTIGERIELQFAPLAGTVTVTSAYSYSHIATIRAPCGDCNTIFLAVSETGQLQFAPLAETVTSTHRGLVINTCYNSRPLRGL